MTVNKKLCNILNMFSSARVRLKAKNWMLKARRQILERKSYSRSLKRLKGVAQW
jgi:hypothetical protein